VRVVTVLYPQCADFPQIKAVEASADPSETGFTLYLPGRKIEITE
jgi:hypothetical protein